MKPREYIASIKVDDPPDKVEESSLPDWLKKQCVDSGQNMADLLASLNESDWAQSLLDRLKPRLHPELVMFLESDFIAIGTVGNTTPDVYVQKLEAGYAIVFHAGLKDFVYRVARVIATRFQPKGTEDHPSSNDNLLATARLIAEVFWWFQETGRAFGPDYPIDQDKINIANLLAMEAETFLIAHEIGHIIDEGLKNHDEQLLKLSNDISPNHRDEFTADFLGLQFVMQLHNEDAERDAFYEPLRYAGVEFALQIYRGLEEVVFESKDSHPPASKRIARIRLEMQDRCHDDSSWRSLSGLALGIDSMFTKLVYIISEPAEHAEFFEREAGRIVSELDALLNKCTGGMVPNYAQFYMSAAEVFRRGYPHKMLERVAEVTADFLGGLQSAKNGKTKTDQAAWVRFQKFKLLFAYIMQHMNEPARSIFMDVFESQQEIG